MNTSTAQMVLDGITVAAAVVWVIGLRFLVVSAQSGNRPVAADPMSPDAPPKNMVHGSTELAGVAADLSQKAATLLAEKGVRIAEQTDERIVFGSSTERVPGQLPGWLAYRGEILFTPLAANATRIDYGLVLPRWRVLLMIGFAVQALGLVTIVAGFFLLQQYVVTSDKPNVRAQAVQMVQVVHLLWPPFLLGGLYRGPRKMVQSQFDTFIHNLPFLKP